MKDFSDKDIIDRLQHGSTTERNLVIKQLYRRCYKQINSFVLKNNGSTTDSQDIFQEAMEIFYFQIQKGKFESKSAPSTYLYGIAKNIWLGQLRKRREVSISSWDYEIAEETGNAQFDLKLFYRLFDELEEDCQRILKCFYFEKMPMKQIVNEFSSINNEQSARTKKYRCLKYLNEIFQKQNIGQENFN
ncbi:MAG: sigma-70 family RNA polymerase sigma factor [Bacteroidota bacterium]